MDQWRASASKSLLLLGLAATLVACAEATPTATLEDWTYAPDPATLMTPLTGVKPELVALLTRDAPGDGRCLSFTGLDGRLTADPIDGTTLIVPQMYAEGPHLMRMWWPKGYTGQRIGGEVQVRAPDGGVVAVTGSDVSFHGFLLPPPEAEEWDGYWGEGMPDGFGFLYCSDPVPWEGM